eukprot:1146073-Rhodomonas_salina.3
MAYWCVINYREAYGMFAVNGILFNHVCLLFSSRFHKRCPAPDVRDAASRSLLAVERRLSRARSRARSRRLRRGSSRSALLLCPAAGHAAMSGNRADVSVRFAVRQAWKPPRDP